MSKPFIPVVLLLGLLLAGPLEAAEGASPAEQSDVMSDLEPPGTYWLRNREGWFWYRDPPEPPRPPKASPRPAEPPARAGGIRGDAEAAR